MPVSYVLYVKILLKHIQVFLRSYYYHTLVLTLIF
jgi:hypothetical protein